MTFKNPYDLGWRKNLKRVFGDVSFLSAVNISRRKPIQPEYPFLPEEIVEDSNDDFGSSTEYRKYGVVNRV